MGSVSPQPWAPEGDPLSAASDALDVAAAVQRREVSAREASAAAIARIEAANPELSFLVAERFEAALEEADRVDPDAPLAGVPILVKDFLTTVEGLALSEGTTFIDGWVSERDSEYVRRLKRAGAIILGSTTTAELAVLSSCETSRYGRTRNPRALERTTGGSSGGSASAVAAGAVPVAHGSDAGGSIRMPAACCGLVGLKPSRGRNPLGPEYGDIAAGLWCEHVLTRSVRDSAAFLDATSGLAPGDPYAAPEPRGNFLEAVAAAPRRLRIAVASRAPTGGAIDLDSRVVLDDTATALSDLGHDVFEGDPGFDVEQAEDAFFTLFSAGLAARVEMWAARLGRGLSAADLEPYTWYLIESEGGRSARELLAAITLLQRCSRQIAAFYESADVWLSPTLGTPPFPLGHLATGAGVTVEDVLERDARFIAFTWPSNMTGQPALSYPAGETPAGLPIGIQLSGRLGEEETLLALAASLERVVPPR